jgi:predicted SprT family Zn-dependent metalloprotease
MKIPKKVKICGHNIKIVKKGKLYDDDKTRCWGFAYLHSNKIELATDDLPESRIAETFLHEILHVIYNLNGIKVTEQENNLIALHLFQVIRENKLRF